MEKEIKITNGKFQEFRKSILVNIGVVLKIIFGNKYLIYKFDKEKYNDYEPKHVTKEEYIQNMIEGEIHDVYNIMTKGYVTVRVGAIEEKRYLTSKYPVCTIENEEKNNTQKLETKDGKKEMIRLTKKDLMGQIKIMRNDLIGGYIDSVVDNCGTYKRINETEVYFWGIGKKVYDYMVELKDCTLLKTPAFKKEVAKYLEGDFKIIGDIKIIVNGIFGTGEVRVDVEEIGTGKVVKDMCYLWDNNCNYSIYKELEKKYPDAEKEFNKKEELKKLEKALSEKEQELLEKTVTIDIDGEGTVEEIKGATYEDANANYKKRKRLAPTEGCNKTFIKLRIDGKLLHETKMYLKSNTDCYELKDALLAHIESLRETWITGFGVSYFTLEQNLAYIEKKYGSKEKLAIALNAKELIIKNLGNNTETIDTKKEPEIAPEPEKKSGFEVRIVNIESGEVVQVMNAPNMRMAEKIESGVLINLNREDYYVEIVDLSQSKNTETTEKIVEKMEEKEMNTINKNALNNRIVKLGNFIKENRNVEDIEKKIFELFPKAMEVDIFGEDKEVIYFLVGQDYVGKAPSKKEMKDIDYKFDSIDKMYGLSVHVEVGIEKIKIDASVGINYTTRYYHREYTDYTVKEMEIELELTMEVAKRKAEYFKERHDKGVMTATYAWEGIKEILQRESTDEVKEFLMEELNYYAHKEKEEKEIENRNEIEVGICKIDLQVQKRILWREKAEEKIERLYKYASTPELKELVDLAIRYIAVRKEDNLILPKKLQEILDRRYKKVVDGAIEKIDKKITGKETPEQIQTILSGAFKNISIINNGQLGCDIQSKIVECYRGKVNEVPMDAVQILRGGEVYIGVEKINANNETIIYVKTKVEYLDTEGEFNTYIDYLYYREIKNNPDPEKEPCLDSQEESGDTPEPQENNLDKMIKNHINEILDLSLKGDCNKRYKYEKTVAVKKQGNYQLTSMFVDTLTDMKVYIGHSGNMILTPNNEKKYLDDSIRGLLSDRKSINETINEIKEKIKRKFEYSYSKSITVIEPDETKVYVLVSPEDTEVFWNYEDAYKKMLVLVKNMEERFSYNYKPTIEEYGAKLDSIRWTIMEKTVL